MWKYKLKILHFQKLEHTCENLPCEKLRKTSCAQKPKREMHRNRGKRPIKNVRNLQPTKGIIALMFKWLTIIEATYILLHDYLCSPLDMVMFIAFHLDDKNERMVIL